MMLEILEDMDELLASNKHFLLSNWLETAKEKGKTSDERKNYEWEARCQITLWSYDLNIYVSKVKFIKKDNHLKITIIYKKVDDYACKAWAGLIKE
jgi:hypothetical protein